MRASIGRAALLVSLACSVGACKSLEKGAREEFGEKFSCPDDRVSVRARSDLEPAEVLNGNQGKRKPPDEVKRDPGRLAKWEKDEQERLAKQNRGYSGYEVFEVSGCDHKLLMVCHHPNTQRGYQAHLVSCDERPLP